MRLFIDSADLDEIHRLYDLYPIDGVTTNPSILAKTRQDPVKLLTRIRDQIGEDQLLFAQALPLTAEGMIRDAHALVSLLGPNTIVKLPSIPEGFKAIRILSSEGISTCGTVVYTPMQAFLAAKAGADYVAPYVNRIDNMGYDGTQVAEKIQDIFSIHEMDCTVLAASFKNSQQVLDLCVYGIGAATCAPDVIDSFVRNLAVDGAVSDFIHDFSTLTGEEKSMADLIAQS